MPAGSRAGGNLGILIHVRVPLSRAAHVAPFVEFLDRIGAPTERGLERNKLPPGLRERPDMLVSTRAQTLFAGDMARREGIEDLGWRVASAQDQMSPRLAQALYRCPSLLQALQVLPALVGRESSTLQIWLVEQGDSWLLCHRGPIEVATGLNELTVMRTAILISIVRAFTAPDWVPTECGIAGEDELGPLVREGLRDAEIRPAPDHSWLRLPRPVLARPPRTRPPVETSTGVAAGEVPAPDLVGSLAQALRPYLGRGAPYLRDAADLAGMSVRSLQRELTRAGSSYRDVLQRAKLDAARELLKNPEAKIVAVAYETGFSDPAHFTHFFRRLTGITPREYRASLLEA